MPTFTERAYHGEADLAPIAQLINTCAAVDQVDDGTTIDELRVTLTFPDFDPTHDMRLWVDEDDAVVGFGRLWLPQPVDECGSGLSLYVAPPQRGHGVEEQIVAWGATRTRDWAAAYVLPVTMRVRTKDSDHQRITFLSKQGFTPRRAFIVMDRPLGEALPSADLPPGFTLHQTTTDDAQAWVDMFNESFVDHYNPHPMTVADFMHYNTDPNANPAFDWVARAADGTFAAFCVGKVDPEANARDNEQVGWIEVLGTRRGYRKQGLGHALLVDGMQRLHAAGMSVARLNVDAESPTGATRLYESVGFQPNRTYISYVKDL